MIREPPPFFHRGPSPLARLTFFMIAAVALMIADHRFRALETVRLSLSVLAHPVQELAGVPSQALGRIADYFASQERLLRENQDLKAKVLEQSAAAQEARLLRAEQEHLLAMGPGKSRYAEGGMLAEVLYTARNPFTRKVVVDKGLKDAMASGMPVIDGLGVVGQVTNVGTFTSEVTLVTEKDQSVPVMLVRNGLRAIAVGSARTARSTSRSCRSRPTSRTATCSSPRASTAPIRPGPRGAGHERREERRVRVRQDRGETRRGRGEPPLRHGASNPGPGAGTARREGRRDQARKGRTQQRRRDATR